MEILFSSQLVCHGRDFDTILRFCPNHQTDKWSKVSQKSKTCQATTWEAFVHGLEKFSVLGLFVLP